MAFPTENRCNSATDLVVYCFFQSRVAELVTVAKPHSTKRLYATILENRDNTSQMQNVQTCTEAVPPNPFCFSSSPRMMTGVIPSSVPTALIS